jgi:hypothetical protein
MRINAKASMALTATFVLGTAVGAFGAAEALRPRDPGPAPESSSGALPRFVVDMERYLQPRDSGQRAALRPFLLTTDSLNRATVQRAEETMLNALRRLRDDVAPVLDTTQRQRLDRFIEEKAVNRRPGPGLDHRPDAPRGRP